MFCSSRLRASTESASAVVIFQARSIFPHLIQHMCGSDRFGEEQRDVVLRRKYSVLLVAAILLVAVLVCGGIALAITYGQPDQNRHPNVGALVGTFDGQSYPYCSGTLISPTVFLTAAHCDIGE